MIYENLISKKKNGKKQLAVLVDPDKVSDEELFALTQEAAINQADYFFVGGSLLVSEKLDDCVCLIKENCKIPVVLFPGSPLQISKHADAILFLSLISGRNAEALIGQHVVAAPYIRRTSLEVIPTGYMLIDAGKPTTVSYMSNSLPIPNDKADIAVCTAVAGEMLGLKIIYLDAGSGAQQTVSEKMISEVAKNINIPLMVGGGIRSGKQALDILSSGADIIVVGNAVEKDYSLLKEISDTVKTITKPVRR